MLCYHTITGRRFLETSCTDITCRHSFIKRSGTGRRGGRLGVQNVITKEYMSRNDIFAEAFNYYVFGGEAILKPEDLRELDSVEGLILADGKGKERVLERYRDLLKYAVIRCSADACFLLIGIENQANIHFAMPVRNMLYDSISYAKQVLEKEKLHRKGKHRMSSGEFLSGFCQDDRLVPVITLVVNFGQESWTAPHSLYEMFAETDKKILRYINDYHINLIDPHRMQEGDFQKLGESLQYVMRFIAASGDRAKMRELLGRYRKNYENLEKDAAELLKACAHMDIHIGKEEEVFDMCKAWDDMAKESMEQGVKQGIERGEDLKVIELVCKKLRKGKLAERIAEELEEEFEKICGICDAAAIFAPEYDYHKVYDTWRSRWIL